MNTTIVLAGGCNANCDFCFWEHDKGTPIDYIDRIVASIERLPAHCRELSITGGEPTLSPYFDKLMVTLLQLDRFDKIVLTTNGFNLKRKLPLIMATVNHINISRHAISLHDNMEAFKTTKVITDNQIFDIVNVIHELTDIDIVFNCVIQENTTKKFIYKYIDYANGLGIDAVSFRKEASNTEPTKVEQKFTKKFGVVGERACPVCRAMVQLVDGYEVRWKGSTVEPSLELGEPYEYVINTDGELYYDWDKSWPVSVNARHGIVSMVKESSDTGYSDCGVGLRSGCGGGGC